MTGLDVSKKWTARHATGVHAHRDLRVSQIVPSPQPAMRRMVGFEQGPRISAMVPPVPKNAIPKYPPLL